MDEYYSQILRQFLGKERIGSTELIDKTTRQSAHIAATSQRTSIAAQPPEPISRKEREIIFLMANMHHIQPPQCPMANAQQIIKGDIAAEKVPNYRCFNDLS